MPSISKKRKAARQREDNKRRIKRWDTRPNEESDSDYDGNDSNASEEDADLGPEIPSSLRLSGSSTRFQEFALCSQSRYGTCI
ncbi:hypothetical protein M407DRAFT_245804 [Tulasnella calospora MUT 4182]|uniref:Uncharacterized protein n=1 Tax=Tulasnella calospora MUT 4182 TaxID=1051891 RepID=A0A0C3KG00_9AGAM|nr:hypothetical protein M407DRAFT_247109 [Tulasnella calospora MUT 4182]KIO20403.1 hypothetical protein M407DRAFT_245804 [Tulasnella calospora MUT 4182]